MKILFRGNLYPAFFQDVKLMFMYAAKCESMYPVVGAPGDRHSC